MSAIHLRDRAIQANRLLLLTESKWNRAQRNITQASVFVTREQQTIVEVDGPGAEPFSSSPTPPIPSTHLKPPEGYFARAMPFSSAVKKQSHDRDVTESAEHAALTRLAYNLSLSLPLILGIGLLFPILGFIGLYSKNTSFAMTELRNDAFAWVVSGMCLHTAPARQKADQVLGHAGHPCQSHPLVLLLHHVLVLSGPVYECCCCNAF